jgi:protein-L-isoaspartate O-methyltransferase
VSRLPKPSAGSPSRDHPGHRVERPERPERSVSTWLSALEARHLANLRLPEVTRALRALSSAYVERRHLLERGAAFDSAGKRAAYALFYGPLHFLVVSHVVRALGAGGSASAILDIGCGTGAAGAAWASSMAEPVPGVTGIDRHPWAVDEARWTYRHFGLSGRTRIDTLVQPPQVPRDSAIVAAYLLNELPDATRRRVEGWLVRAGDAGARVLVLEPVARAVTPWWNDLAARAADAGGRVDEWRFRTELPPLIKLLDRSTGMDHAELTARSLWIPGGGSRS